jgi:DinB family protein
MRIDRPAAGEYAPYFERYVSRVPEADALPVLERQRAEVREAFSGVPESKGGFRYAEGKWSVREMLGHVIDTERIFAYRALCIARGETAPLPGFEQDDYVAKAGHDGWTLPELLDDFDAVRRANVALLAHMDEAALRRVGTSSGHPTSVRAVAYILAGHVRHHLGVLAERYGVGRVS